MSSPRRRGVDDEAGGATGYVASARARVALLTMLLVTALVALLATTLLTQQARLLSLAGQVDRYSTRKALALGEGGAIPR